MAQIQMSITRDVVNPWDSVCCEACWNAAQERCTCRCGGTYHGAGNPNNNGKQIQKRNRIIKKLSWESKKYITYPSAQRYKALITDPHCHCGYDLSKEPVLAYNHSDGWEIEESNEFQWLWITCPKCGYDMSLWKLGVSRIATILVEAS